MGFLFCVHVYSPKVGQTVPSKLDESERTENLKEGVRPWFLRHALMTPLETQLLPLTPADIGLPQGRL